MIKPESPAGGDITVGTDTVAAAALALHLPGFIGYAGAATSMFNDQSWSNYAVNAVGLIPAAAVPTTAYGIASDGAEFITDQGLAPMYNAAPTKTVNVNGVSYSNPEGSDLGDW